MNPYSTGGAIAITAILTIPGFLVGGLVAIFYRAVIALWVYGGLLDILPHDWPSRLFVTGMSEFASGFIGAGGAAYLCSKIVRRADYRTVAFVCSTLFIALVVGLTAFKISTDGLQGDEIGIAANIIGLVVGYFLVASKTETKSGSVQPAASEAPEGPT